MITSEGVTVQTIVWGRETVQTYPLSDGSRAEKWFSPNAGRKTTPRPSGIRFNDIKTSNGGALFGDSLSPVELDWIEWRINRFLHPDDAAQTVFWLGAEPREGQTVEDQPDRTPNKPPDSTTRIKEDAFVTRIQFPNAIQSRSPSRIIAASATFAIGLAWSAWFVYMTVSAWIDRQEGSYRAWLLFAALAAFGLSVSSIGLFQLFGRTQLIISSKKIAYCTKLVGIGPCVSFPTANVIGLGIPDCQRSSYRQAARRAAALKSGCVIRTAARDLYYGGAVPAADVQWVSSEVNQKIRLARKRA